MKDAFSCWDIRSYGRGNIDLLGCPYIKLEAQVRIYIYSYTYCTCVLYIKVHSAWYTFVVNTSSVWLTSLFDIAWEWFFVCPEAVDTNQILIKRISIG